MGTVEERVLIVREDLYERFQVILTETQMETNELIEHLFELYNSNVEKVWSESEETKKLKKDGLHKETEYWMKKILSKSEREKIFGKRSEQEKCNDSVDVDEEDDFETQTSAMQVDGEYRSLPISAPTKEKESEITLQNLPQLLSKLPEKQAQTNRIILSLPSNLLSRDISINISNKMTKIKPKVKSRDTDDMSTRESSVKERDSSVMGDNSKGPTVDGGNSYAVNAEQNTPPSNVTSACESVANTDENSSSSTEVSQADDASNKGKNIPHIVDVTSIKQEVNEVFCTESQSIAKKTVQSETEVRKETDKSDSEGGTGKRVSEMEGVNENGQLENLGGDIQPATEGLKDKSQSGIMFVNSREGTTTVQIQDQDKEEYTSSTQYGCESFSVGNEDDDVDISENLEMTVDEVDDSHQEDTKFVRDLALNIAKNMAVTENGETVFNCNFCNYKTSVIGRLRRHITVHTGKEFKCPFCEKDYTEKCKLKEHIKVKHEKSVSYPCSKCPKKFTTKRGRDYHNVTYHEERGTVLKCSFCPKEFSSRFGFTYHTKTAHGENKVEENFESTKETLIPMTKWEKSTLKKGDKEFPKDKDGNYSCKLCEYKTPRMFHIKRHLSVHFGNTNKCTECGKTFSDPYKLRIHIQVKHGTLRFDCPQCRKSFGTKEGLKYHRITAHEGNWKYLCTECGKCFYQKHHFEGHMNKHKGIKAFECKDCGQKFTYRSDVSIHKKHCGEERRPLEKPEFFVCHVCGDQFKKKSVLTEHVMGKHGIEGTYICACGVSFKWRNSLRQHKQRCTIAATATSFMDIDVKQEMESTEYILDQSCASMDEGQEETLYEITEEELEQNQAMLGIDRQTTGPEEDNVEEGVSPSRTNKPCYQVSDSESGDTPNLFSNCSSDIDISEGSEQGLREWNTGRLNYISSSSDEEVVFTHFTHKNTRAAHKPFPYFHYRCNKTWKCSSCGKLFQNKSWYQRHKNMCHLRSSVKSKVLEMYICGFCDGRFSNKTHLREHIVQKHGISGHYKRKNQHQIVLGKSKRNQVTFLRNEKTLKSDTTDDIKDNLFQQGKPDCITKELGSKHTDAQSQQNSFDIEQALELDSKFCQEETPKGNPAMLFPINTSKESSRNVEGKVEDISPGLKDSEFTAPIVEDCTKYSQIQETVLGTKEEEHASDSLIEVIAIDSQSMEECEESSVLQDLSPQVENLISDRTDYQLQNLNEYPKIGEFDTQFRNSNTADRLHSVRRDEDEPTKQNSCVWNNGECQDIFTKFPLKDPSINAVIQGHSTENEAQSKKSEYDKFSDGSNQFHHNEPSKRTWLQEHLSTEAINPDGMSKCKEGSEVNEMNTTVSVIDLSNISDTKQGDTSNHSSAKICDQESQEIRTLSQAVGHSAELENVSFQNIGICTENENQSEMYLGCASDRNHSASIALCESFKTELLKNKAQATDHFQDLTNHREREEFSVNYSAKSVKLNQIPKVEQNEISGAGNLVKENGEGFLQCKICGDKFTRPAYLREHILGKHSNLKRYSCACGQMFKWRSSLNLHRGKCSLSGRMYKGINGQTTAYINRSNNSKNSVPQRFPKNLYKKQRNVFGAIKSNTDIKQTKSSENNAKPSSKGDVRNDNMEEGQQNWSFPSFTGSLSAYLTTINMDNTMMMKPATNISHSMYQKPKSETSKMFLSQSNHNVASMVTPSSVKTFSNSGSSLQQFVPYTCDIGDPQYHGIQNSQVTDFSHCYSLSSQRKSIEPMANEAVVSIDKPDHSSVSVSNNPPSTYKQSQLAASDAMTGVIDLTNIKQEKVDPALPDINVQETVTARSHTDTNIIQANNNGTEQSHFYSGYKIPSIMHLFQNKNTDLQLSSSEKLYQNSTNTGGLNKLPLVCHLCKQMCPSLKHFEDHMKLHNIPCSSQSTAFSQEAPLQHKANFGVLFNSESKLESKELYKCKICGDTFMMKSYLREHEQGMHGSGMRYSCVCGQTFRWRSSLGSHQRKCPASGKYIGGT